MFAFRVKFSSNLPSITPIFRFSNTALDSVTIGLGSSSSHETTVNIETNKVIPIKLLINFFISFCLIFMYLLYVQITLFNTT